MAQFLFSGPKDVHSLLNVDCQSKIDHPWLLIQVEEFEVQNGQTRSPVTASNPGGKRGSFPCHSTIPFFPPLRKAAAHPPQSPKKVTLSPGHQSPLLTAHSSVFIPSFNTQVLSASTCRTQ